MEKTIPCETRMKRARATIQRKTWAERSAMVLKGADASKGYNEQARAKGKTHRTSYETAMGKGS